MNRNRGKLSAITVFVADRHPVYRQGLIHSIQQDCAFRLIGEAGTVAETRAATTKLSPDLLTVDLEWDAGDGFELIQSVLLQSPTTHIVVITRYDEGIYGERALRAGARGYLMKGATGQEILSGLHAVSTGELIVSRKLTVLLLHQHVSNSSSRAKIYIRRLTNRELVVFEMIGAGKSTVDIATDLKLSPKTIASHREAIKHKLGLRNSTDLVCHAVHWVSAHGWTPPGQEQVSIDRDAA